MWSQGASLALLLFVGLIIALAVLVATLLSVWKNRSAKTETAPDKELQRD